MHAKNFFRASSGTNSNGEKLQVKKNEVVLQIDEFVLTNLKAKSGKY